MVDMLVTGINMSKKKIIKIKVGKLIRVTPGKRHAYYESNIGEIRKPIRKGGE